MREYLPRFRRGFAEVGFNIGRCYPLAFTPLRAISADVADVGRDHPAARGRARAYTLGLAQTSATSAQTL
jgi:hypothetical protein